MVCLFEAGTNVIDVPQKMIFTDNKGKTHILPTLTGKKHILSSHYGKKQLTQYITHQMVKIYLKFIKVF